MADIDYRQFDSPPAAITTESRSASLSWMRSWWFLLMIALVLLELFLPILIWKAGLPRVFRFSTDVVAGFIVAVTIAYMLLRDRIPAMILVVLGITVIWGGLSLAFGQSMGATGWAWWEMFKYPLLTLFAYLIPDWPRDFPRWLIKCLVILLAFEVTLQLIQYALGWPIGDNLAGTFGPTGNGHYGSFLFFMLCLAMGYWSSTGDLKLPLVIIVLGIVANLLAENKFFIVVVPVVGMASILLHLIQGKKARQTLFLTTLLFLMTIAFVVGYEKVVVPAMGSPSLTEFARSPELLEWYVFQDPNDRGTDRQIRDYNNYRIRRGTAVIYAWEQIRGDVVTSLFGFGLGSRLYSDSVGLYGHYALGDPYGIVGMKDLPKFMMEFGLLGLLMFLLFCVWIVVKLFRHMRTNPDQNLTSLEFAMIIFTAFWPLWLFYQAIWYAGVVMTIYWVTLGYLFQQINRRPKPARIKTKMNTGVKTLQ